MWSNARGRGRDLARSCRLPRASAEPHFPAAHRHVAPIVGDTFSTEDARDRLGEAEEVMELAGVKPGMSVADVGAGEGYYTVRLARVVGPRAGSLPRTSCRRFATAERPGPARAASTMSR